MKFEELLKAGQAMPTKDLHANLQSLAADPRFAAVLGLIERRKVSFTRAVSSPALAAKPGDLTHVAGGLHEALNLLDTLKNILEPPAPRGEKPPES